MINSKIHLRTAVVRDVEKMFEKVVVCLRDVFYHSLVSVLSDVDCIAEGKCLVFLNRFAYSQNEYTVLWKNRKHRQDSEFKKSLKDDI